MKDAGAAEPSGRPVPPPRLRQPSRRELPPEPAIPAADTGEMSRWQRTLLWVTGIAGTGYGVSLLFHTGLLLGFAYWVLDLHFAGPDGGGELGFTLDDGSAFDFGSEDSIHQEAGGRDAEMQEPQPVALLVAKTARDPIEQTREQVDATLPTEVPSTGAGEGVDEGDGTVEQAGGGRKIGSNAIQSSDGVFTVYVTPARALAPDEKPEGFDPEPNEAYYTYIYIAIPDEVENLKFTDIEGRIVGTDAWETNIPYDTLRTKRQGAFVWKVGTATYFYNPGSSGVEFAPVNSYHLKNNRRIPIVERTIDGVERRYAVLRLTVPPAGQEGIRDTIWIACKPLGKEARLEVVF